MKKALFFDIDGTLYDYKGHMPASAGNALAMAREKGHELVICSGRSLFQLYPGMAEEFDGIICSTGALVKRRGELIYEHYMPEETLRKIVSVFQEAGGYLAIMTEKHLKLNQECRDYLVQKFSHHFADPNLIHQVMGSYELTNDLTKYRDVKKMLYYESRWDVSQVAQALSDCCDVTATSFEEEVCDSGEITVKGINKALGIQKYIERNGIAREDTIAFGDGPNDLDMISYAGIGVAMGNARVEVKQEADFITSSVNEDGIARAMQELGIL